MLKKYAILNPLDGSYVFETEHDLAVSKVAEIALALYKAQAHDVLCSYVDVADDGSETWFAEDGTRVISPAEMQAEFEAQAKIIRPMGKIPVTIAGA